MMAPQPAAPPPGYGYSYTPPPLLPQQHAALAQELASIDSRLLAIRVERSRHRIGGAIATMIVGYGAAAFAAAVGLMQWRVAREIKDGDFTAYNNRGNSGSSFAYYEDEDYDLNNDGVINNRDYKRARRISRTGAAFTFMGLGLGIWGTVRLLRQLDKRRETAPELEQLRDRRKELLRSLQYGGGYSMGSWQLGLSGKF